MALVSPAGNWLRVNRSLSDIVGYSEGELLESDFQAITHEDDLGNDLAQIFACCQASFTPVRWRSVTCTRTVMKSGLNEYLVGS